MIAVGCDPAGYTLAHRVMEHLQENGHECVFVGAYDLDNAHYPVFGERVGLAVASGKAQRGIVICGSGIGISIAANKVPGVRAALCFDVPSAVTARRELNANVLAGGGRVVGAERYLDVVDAFVNTAFDEKFAQNVEKIDAVEKKYHKALAEK